ncbi:MAG: 4-alpha-glucanotransferase, partial [Acidobacteriota bacterium]
MTAPAPRQSGIGVPLFSLSSSRSWGIGEFGDVPAFARWCAAAGQRYVQLLPLNEISPGETSPYSSMTAMALDPLYLHVPAVPEFAALGGEGALASEQRDVLAAVRADARVRYREVRRLKEHSLANAYAYFRDFELAHDTERARAFRAYATQQSWWLDVYTTFRAIHAAHDECAWWDWPPGLAYGDAVAVREATVALADQRQY